MDVWVSKWCYQTAPVAVTLVPSMGSVGATTSLCRMDRWMSSMFKQKEGCILSTFPQMCYQSNFQHISDKKPQPSPHILCPPPPSTLCTHRLPPLLCGIARSPQQASWIKLPASCSFICTATSGAPARRAPPLNNNHLPFHSALIVSNSPWQIVADKPPAPPSLRDPSSLSTLIRPVIFNIWFSLCKKLCVLELPQPQLLPPTPLHPPPPPPPPPNCMMKSVFNWNSVEWPSLLPSCPFHHPPSPIH